MMQVEAVRERAFRALYDGTYLQVLSYCLRRCDDRAGVLDAAADAYVAAWLPVYDEAISDEAIAALR